LVLAEQVVWLEQQVACRPQQERQVEHLHLAAMSVLMVGVGVELKALLAVVEAPAVGAEVQQVLELLLLLKIGQLVVYHLVDITD